VIPQIRTANSKRPFTCRHRGRGRGTQAFTPTRALLQQYSSSSRAAACDCYDFSIAKAACCLPPLMQGEILGPNSPQRCSPSSHPRLRKAGSAHRRASTAAPGRGAPTRANAAERSTAVPRHRALLEVTGHSPARAAKRRRIATASAALGPAASSDRAEQGLPSRPRLQRGRPKLQPEPCPPSSALGCEHAQRCWACCIQQPHSSEPAGY